MKAHLVPVRRISKREGNGLAKASKKRQNKRAESNRLGMLAIAVTVLLLLGVMMVKSRELKKTLAVYETRAASLEQEIEEQKDRTEEIDQLKEYMQTDEYIEQVARERFGLVKDNEIVFEEEN